MLWLSATDDRAPPDQLGYRLTVVDGQPPRGIETDATLRLGDGNLPLPFARDTESFTFDLEIRAVDLNGNEGPPLVVTIEG